MLRPLFGFGLVGLLIAAVACESPTDTSDPSPPDSTVVQKGARLLAIAISDRADGDFNVAYDQAVQAGMEVTSLSLSWDDLETSPGVYDPAIDFLAIGADYYGSRGTQLALGINPIDTNNNRVPGHLSGLAWDDPAMIQAFEDLLDWALPKVAGVDLVYLSIGNEIDATLSSAADWAAYQAFFEATAAHARSLRSGLRVGSKVTHGGLMGGSAVSAASLNGATDIVLTTFYPLNSDFTIQAPTAAGEALDAIATAYPGRPVMFAEIGTPSTSQCGSSEALQAAFVREAFAAWDRHATQVEMLEFVWMHDISQDALNTYESYYGLSDACFLDYLATLGLKDAQGVDKPAWVALTEEAAARGW
ncbi:MAG: hypothetical protein ACR2QM_08765 [Longimicrobiales bacterium]